MRKNPETFEREDEIRRRIERQLHDTVAQHGAALQINLSLIAESRPALGPRALKALSDSIELAQTLAVDIREIANVLHPPLLDQFGLIPAFETWAKGFEPAGVKIKLALPAQLDRLPARVETSVFRIVEECMTDLRKAGAFLGITREPKLLVLEMHVPGSRTATETMRARARLIGARLTSQKGSRNTRFRLTLPLRPAKKSTAAGS